MIRFDILFFMGLVAVCESPVLQCPNTTVIGKDGKPVILPCSTKDKMDISYDRIEWLFKDPTKGEDKDVHTYYQRKDQLYKQSDDFKGRTSLFKDKLSSGNCSLRLNGTTSHSGTYYCRVAGNLSCNLTLRVLPKGTDDSYHDPNNSGTDRLTAIYWTIGVLAVVALIIIIIIAVVVHLYRKRQNEPVAQNPNEERIQMI